MQRRTGTIENKILALLLVLGILTIMVGFSQARADDSHSLLGLSSKYEHETYLYTGGLSWHWSESDYDYQSKHKLLGIKHGRVMAMYFENSYYEDSFFVGYEVWQKKILWDYEAGVSLGPTYGYRDCLKGWSEQGRRVCATPMATLAATHLSGQPVLALIPGAWTLTFRWHL